MTALENPYIIFNPSANCGKSARVLAVLVEFLEIRNINYALKQTQGKYNATEIVKDIMKNAAPDKEVNIIIVGGDGTIFEAVNGLDSGNNAVLGIIPAGTGNDVARTLGIPKNPRKAAELLVQNRAIYADVAEINGGLKSALFVSYGIAAEIVLGMAKLKRKSRLSYFASMLRSVAGFSPKRIKIRIDDEEQERIYNAEFLSVHNCVYAGGGMYLAKNAKMNDGYLDLVIVEYRSGFRRVLNIISILCKKLHNQPNFSTLSFRKIEMISPDENRCVIDGEIHEFNNLQIRVIPGFVKILY
ncbi:MAG: diacylglycerol kinase family lipid kinase [Defluviitaleaceae bacterium]|nr:diacylglycerol kinase family lipid kinase [Defluviitaleaceae bacterium]